ncbi:alpha/beta hydrolase [Zobellia galactanivorans]|uniref:Conserved hypothetical periplasmic protein n=1 Tax=Zobellia galactanivorans (strain DSM 12802 / CCUG 47099 / CIP 106680 / NCIMB 13871 / Dsij) TaxID=63186 RepID=G0L1A8_ZOBGA|nr:hypothetical protein [Zobellia galactanivorans]CAZ97741.1 Conserved hypothetical periplasmic protein [Zobellia galactanivorans]
MVKNVIGICIILILGTSQVDAQKDTPVRLPDIASFDQDLFVPDITQGPPEAGKRVRQTLASYQNTEVYHLLYLPSNYKEGKKYPVIVEYPGNGPYTSAAGDLSTGQVDGCNLGYGLSEGKDFIWVSMPFISVDGQENQKWWWGDIEASKKYCMDAVKEVCDKYGGDASKVVLAGFSRGAIAVNYIGLRDDEISPLWKAFIVNSHYDGLKTWDYPNSDKASALERLKRLNGRPQFICAEGHGTSKSKNYLAHSGIQGNFTFMDIPIKNHTNTWPLYQLKERKIIRAWLSEVIEKN